MECLQVIKEAIPRKTVSKWRFRLVICWIAVGTVLCGAFSIVESKESRFDFRCDVRDEIDKDIIRDECYDQYLQSHEIGIPSYFFILVNVSLIPIVTALYSYCVKSTVSSYQDVEGEPRNQKGSRRLFSAYLFQLVVSIALGITFIALLQTHLLYPTNFPCSNTKFSVKFVSNRTQSTKSFSCFHNRAGKKNFWTKTATAANAIYATSALLEILLILKRARGGKILMNDRQFYADYLKSNSDEERLLKNDTQNDVQSDIQTLRENCLRDTKQPSDLLQPFGRLNPGEGHTHDLKMDDIYVNVAIREGRAHHYSAKPEDIINKEKTNVLVFGRPGIGKTSFCTKILRLWASGEAFNGDHGTTSAHFDVVFLVKFRLLNDNAELSLRELLARAETIQSLDDPVWDFINKDPTKVLLIFDGLDEYSRKEDINAQDDDDPTYKNDVEEKIPVSVLYNKLAAGKLLRGASILTTTRPKAVEFVEHVNFQTTVEIRGFTSENVEEYVEKFTRDVPGAKEKILGHIKSNINLLSLCYIPENCFFICHCLLQIILSEPPQALPKKMTDIYKMTVKMFLFNHNREGVSPEELERLKSTHLYKPFDKFPEELQNILSSLREISFKGIEEGRRLFESSEVGDLEDCGLLHKLPDLKRQALDDPSKSQFCFTHLTMQEFFAAKHLVDTKTDEGIEEFVCNHVNNSTWQVVLQFVAGLLQSSSDIFIKLLPESKATKTIERSSISETLTPWPATRDKDLAVHVCKCLYEINDEQRPLLQSKIEKIKLNAVSFSACSLAPTDLTAILHFLESAEEVLYIDLSLNEFGDLEAKEVKNFIVNKERKLKQLNLCNNDFTDTAAKDLAAALEHSNCKLEWLDLSYNNFTDNAAKDLAAALMHGNCKLQHLDLRPTNFSEEVRQNLTDADGHRNCKVLLGHSGNSLVGSLKLRTR